MWVTPFSKISIFIVCDVFWNTASNLINFCFLFPFLFFIIEQYGYGLNVIQDSIGLASVITCHQDVLQSVSLINFQFWIFCKLLDCRFLGRFSVSLNSRGLYEELSLSSKSFNEIESFSINFSNKRTFLSTFRIYARNTSAIYRTRQWNNFTVRFVWRLQPINTNQGIFST